MERRDIMDRMASQVHLQRRVYMERRDNRVCMERNDNKVYVERKACVETRVTLKENREFGVHHQEKPPTLAGVGQPAPLVRQLMQAHIYTTSHHASNGCVSYDTVLCMIKIKADFHILSF